MSGKTLIIIIFTLLSYLFLGAQTNRSFRHIAATDGLPDNNLVGVFHIPDGRLCIRTTAMLCLYDGCKFISYPYEPYKSYHWQRGGLPVYHYVDSLHNMIWVKERDMLRVFNIEHERYELNVDSLLRTLGVEYRLSNIFIDETNRHWFLSDRNGLQMYDHGQLHTKPYNEANTQIIGLNSIGRYCWIVYSNGTISCRDLTTDKLIKEDHSFSGLIKPESRVILRMLHDGSFWLMWDDGIMFYEITSDRWIIPENIHIPVRDVFTTIDIDSAGNAYVGTGMSGMYVINLGDFTVRHFPEIPMSDGSVINNDITNIAINPATGDVWIAFMFQGLAHHYSRMTKFSSYKGDELRSFMTKPSVRCMAELPDGDIMLGTLSGLYVFNPTSGNIEPQFKELADKLCLSMLYDSLGRLWVGTLYDGLYKIENGRVAGHYHFPDIEYKVFQRDANYNCVRAICEDRDGNIWVSVTGGVCHFDTETGKYTLLNDMYPDLSNYTTCTSFVEDTNGQLIVGSTMGLYYYNSEQGFIWSPEVDAPNDRRFIHSNTRYNHMLRDSHDRYWFGTQNGLNFVDMKHDTCYCLTMENGLSNNVIKTIVEDDVHDIWVSTTNGINKIVVSDCGSGRYGFDITTFNETDGLLRGEYYENSGIVANDGTVYFGGIDGFSFFRPNRIGYSQTECHPILTGFYLFNSPIRPGESYNGRKILDKSIGYTKSVDLAHNENFITIEFSGLNFTHPEQTYYKYRLDGFEDNWNEISVANTSGQAVYKGLPPGKYRFMLYAANDDKVWSVKPVEFDITVNPPIWATMVAKIIYLIIAVVALVWIYVCINRRNSKRVMLMRQTEQRIQKEKLDQMKFKFFTNISHEFRTPLTLIITPLEAYIKQMDDGADKRKMVSIHRNAVELMGLVNQLLDFRKLEMKGEPLNLLQGNFLEFVAYTCTPFQEIAQEKNITLNIDTDGIDNPYMYFDRDKIHKVLNNLLSNAFKFTHEGGIISIEAVSQMIDGRKYVSMKVSDTGIGIAQEDLPHVFDRFYQAKDENKVHRPGSGIGLHIIKEYVTIHGGKVGVDSTYGIGSTFTITIPADLTPGKTDTSDKSFSGTEMAEPATIEPITEISVDVSPDNNLPMILVVEDNREFREFLCEQLGEHYRVAEASDGEEGLRMAEDKNPALIVSDIMMPKMDGIELCRRIKTDIRTSHIPVILLTARSSDESRAIGYKAGADSYISKPFSMEVLNERAASLIKQQQQRHEIFRKQIEVSPSEITITSSDEQFVRKALECVERNMDNSEYSVEQLSAELATTRATLYRKMQSITDQTPKDFIRTIRLKRAAQLLRDSDLSVSEIADRTGFSTARIFAKAFKGMFGMLPSQYRE